MQANVVVVITITIHVNFSFSFSSILCGSKNFRYWNVSIRRSYLCLFTSSVNTHWISFQRFSTCSLQSLVFNIHWFSLCNCCLSWRYRAFISDNFSHLFDPSECHGKVETDLFLIRRKSPSIFVGDMFISPHSFGVFHTCYSFERRISFQSNYPLHIVMPFN